jgi:L-glyceraldehyde 3-phosphate reductase
MKYLPSPARYSEMEYRYCGGNKLRLPLISLGLWHNFGFSDDLQTCRKILHTAFDHGVTHFDLANNYGPPPGSAEINFGRLLHRDLGSYRDELVISTKAGYYMWPGPYGDGGSRKYLIASLDQSLKRMGLEYVDIFYSHRPDENTSLEETMMALHQAVQSGKALYAGISNYNPEQTRNAARILRSLNTPCLIHQPKYSMLVREPENGLLDVLEEEDIGCIAFSPLAQGLLTDRYFKGIPDDSRAARDQFLKRENITPRLLKMLGELNGVAAGRGQSLAQMAISWLLKDERVTSLLIGASSAAQLKENLGSMNNLEYSREEIRKINQILKHEKV